MIILIIGPQSSGKSTIANKILSFSVRLTMPEVIVFDDFNFDETLTPEFLASLYAPEVLDLKTVFVTSSGCSIPKWFWEKFDPYIIRTFILKPTN
jgi:AAA+ ATPase superfamily predicted ATPase